MPNMSYCRFVNTFRDLEDCYDALIEGDERSDAEQQYAEKLVDLCAEIIYDAKNGTLPGIERELDD